MQLNTSEHAARLLAGLKWLTVRDAGHHLERETGVLCTDGQLLQLAGNGALRLSFRVEGAMGTPWTPASELMDMLRARFTELGPRRSAVPLAGLFDLELVEGGQDLIDLIRWRAIGAPHTVTGSMFARPSRIKVVDERGAAYALLVSAKTHIDGIGDVTISGAYAYASPLSWPPRFAGFEPVVRIEELSRVIDAGVRQAANCLLNDVHRELSAAPGSAVVVEPVPETAQERRVRLLAWYEEEVERRGARGANQRVFVREKAGRPTADRSNVGKDIRKAREERDEQRRCGMAFEALGR